MENSAYRVTVSPSQTQDVLAIISSLDGKASVPAPASSTANPLNAPVSGGDIQAYAEMITAVFAAGSAGLIFLEKLLKLARDTKSRIRITDAKTNKSAEIDERTKEEDIRKNNIWK